jgi:hypothetical protein
MKSQFLSVCLFFSVHGFILGMDLSIVDPVRLSSCGSPSSFYYRKSVNVGSPKTTSVDFDLLVTKATEVSPASVKGQIVVQGRPVGDKSKRRVSFSAGTEFPERQSKKINVFQSVIDCLIS